MKFSAILALSLIWVAPLFAQDGGEFSPQPIPEERYREIWEKSPFTLATSVLPQGSGLAQRYALTGIAMVAGEPIVFLLDRKSLSRLIVRQGDARSGIELVAVSPAHDTKSSSVTIRAGGEQALIGYDTGQAGTLAAKVAASSPNTTLSSDQSQPAKPTAARSIKRMLINLFN